MSQVTRKRACSEPHLSMTEDIRDKCLSPTKLNSGTSKQVQRTHSPSRKGSSSGVKGKRQSSSSASVPTVRGQSTKQSRGGHWSQVRKLNTWSPGRKSNTCAFAAPPSPGVKDEFWKLINNVVQDEVYSVVKSDVSITEYGIRQKLRELGWLLICSREVTIQDHIKPATFMHVVQAVKHVAGCDSEKKHTSSQVLHSKLSIAWQWCPFLSKAAKMQTYRTTTVQQKMLVQSTDYTNQMSWTDIICISKNSSGI